MNEQNDNVIQFPGNVDSLKTDNNSSNLTHGPLHHGTIIYEIDTGDYAILMGLANITANEYDVDYVWRYLTGGNVNRRHLEPALTTHNKIITGEYACINRASIYSKEQQRNVHSISCIYPNEMMEFVNSRAWLDLLFPGRVFENEFGTVTIEDVDVKNCTVSVCTQRDAKKIGFFTRRYPSKHITMPIAKMLRYFPLY